MNIYLGLNNNDINWWTIIVPAIISGLITIGGMIYTNNQNQKRWENDGYLKRKIELEIRLKERVLAIRELLKDFNIDEIFKLNQKQNFINEDLQSLNEINEKYRKVLDKLCVLDYSHHFTRRLKLHEIYDINLLLEEFADYNTQAYTLKKDYQEFIDNYPWYKYKDCDQISLIETEDLNDDKLKKIIEIINNLIYSLDKFLDSIKRNKR